MIGYQLLFMQTFSFRAFIVCLGNANTARILRIGKKDDGSPGNITAALDFPKVSYLNSKNRFRRITVFCL